MKKYYRIPIFVFIVTVMMLIVTSCGEEDVTPPSIELNESSISLVEGSSKKLTATVTGGSASVINWSSSDTKVATVTNDGTVTAVSAGEAVIIVKMGDVTKFCDVTVTEKIISVESVSLNKTSMELSIGDVEQLVAQLNPAEASNKQITWSSNKTEVATVAADGKVTAVAIGEAVITVTTADGNKTAQCEVTVKTVEVESVTLNKSTMELGVGKEEQLIAQVKPDNAYNKQVTWSSSNTGVATVAVDGKVTAVAIGQAVITVTTEDGNKTATCAVTVREKYVSPIMTFGWPTNDVTSYETFDGDTRVRATVATHSPVFRSMLPPEVVIPEDATVLKFEYKFSGPQLPAGGIHAFVLLSGPPYVASVPGKITIALDPTDTWTTSEIDMTAALASAKTAPTNPSPHGWIQEHIVLWQLDAWAESHPERVWEIKNVRIEEK